MKGFSFFMLAGSDVGLVGELTHLTILLKIRGGFTDHRQAVSSQVEGLHLRGIKVRGRKLMLIGG